MRISGSLHSLLEKALMGFSTGIVTHITFELDKMTYAMLSPLKQDVKLAIPPPAGYKIPAAVKWKYTEAERLKAEADFIKKAGSFYSEWFWFAYQSKSWVNCWYELPQPCIRKPLSFSPENLYPLFFWYKG